MSANDVATMLLLRDAEALAQRIEHCEPVRSDDAEVLYDLIAALKEKAK